MKKNHSQSPSIKDLILLCIYSMLKKSKNCTFAKLIKECFSSFPDAFSFSDIPEWPDSRKLDRPLRRLRQEKMIERSLKLTKKGEKKAREISEYLRQMRLKI